LNEVSRVSDLRKAELPIPDAAKQDAKARELIRVWAACGKQHIVLATKTWDDPAVWGIVLVDLARHLAKAHSQRGVRDAEQILDRIRQGFDAEWTSPTDRP
jgi:hypothetical protein